MRRIALTALMLVGAACTSVRPVTPADIEIAHSAEGREGVLIMLVETEVGERFAEGLTERGFKASLHAL